jgi:DNA-binding Lrp family transcriptional regulator
MSKRRKRNLSERDLHLLSAVESSPNSTTKELSDVTKIPVSTVAKRLSKLKEMGVSTSCVNRAVLEDEFPIRAIMGINLDSTRLDSPFYKNQQEFAVYLKKGPWNYDEKFKMLARLVLVHRALILFGGGAGNIMIEVSARTPVRYDGVSYEMRAYVPRGHEHEHRNHRFCSLMC